MEYDRHDVHRLRLSIYEHMLHSSSNISSNATPASSSAIPLLSSSSLSSSSFSTTFPSISASSNVLQLPADVGKH